ncbi:MAG TPA: HAD family hydrolase [Candidatus Polarisedimenticolia bacterium]|nr:HAD family hydrolase [Candidatus Polarisedimenticolia bacterium]
MNIRQATIDDVVSHCERLADQNRRLRPGLPPIAAFDADGTLWGADVADLLWDRLIAREALAARSVAPLARALRSLGAPPSLDPYADFSTLRDRHRRGECPEATMVRAMLEGLAGLRQDEVSAHAQEAVSAVDEIRELASGPVGSMLASLRELDFRIVVVSSSPRWAVEAAVRPLGLAPSSLIAGEVAVVEGVLTEGIIEPLPWGQGKVQSILKRFGAVPRVAVGNGLGDLPMLEATSHLRLLVNPTDALMSACDRITGTTWSMGLPQIGRPVREVKPAVRAAMGKEQGPTRRRPVAGS